MSKHRPTSSTAAAVSRVSPAQVQPAVQDPPPGYAIDLTAPPMLRYQSSLPNLPIPSLQSTATKYLETVRPLVTPSAYKRTEELVNAFVASPQATELQRRLEARRNTEGTKNWLSDWWNQVAYMGYRDPVVVFVSYFFVHVDDRLRRDPAKRAASLVKAMLPFRELVESGKLEPEKVRGTPLCMDSYKWLFHACRYPVKPSDTAFKFDPNTHNHIVAIRRNRFYVVPLVDESGRELSAAELQVQFERIIKRAASSSPALPIGALSSDNRDLWADARKALIAASTTPGHNAKMLQKIESAMIVVALHEVKPVTREDISWNTWVGDGRNRWYDKHQLIVYDNGRSGFLGEHSCMDGTPTLRMNEYILATIALNKADLGPQRTPETGKNLPEPEELVFEVNDEVKELVRGAEKRFDELVANHDLQVLHYEGYGKDYIKQYKLSPDAWAQLIKQLAFHKMYNRPGVTYESAQTRKYQLGRTEVIRSASNESKEWAEAMLGTTNLEKDALHLKELFKKAVARHVSYSAWAANGEGVDRHLFGLKKCVKTEEGEEMPDLYKDESFAKSGSWELSTSQLSSPYIDGWGYGEVVPDGYGLSYAIGSDHIRWTITSMNMPNREFRHYLAEASTEVKRMMDAAHKVEMRMNREREVGKAKL
ncbi:hypothetical protein AMATHDRAFT_55212 [Amanita thiersii Skay4041]|uniref:Carnitine O-acetyltransferase, mitochondrial n=1 Tax=Amanita thiersii Skay4041 TaxID=703135 RepID=A0A2A9NZ80_9AGAR|nr:hypothetical protein AMATHDRAFT_55212 [Amanita thiersii Skay4041]